MQSYNTEFTVEQTPEQAFTAITDVRAWWSGNIEGVTDELGAEFTYRYQDVHYTKQRITEFVPGQKVVWHIEEAYLNFTEEPDEWVGTDVSFEITPKAGETELRFTHRGLVPEFECFEACSSAWGFYVNGSLKR
ncbi:MAG: SRPBCC family protein, partial [Solirubrobacteraceae bacterium]